MKTSALIQNRPIFLSLFQSAARMEDFAPLSILETAPPLNRTPFVELVLHPEKLEAALKTAKSENDAFEASRHIFDNSPTGQAERDLPGGSTTGKDKSRRQVPTEQPSGLTKIEFSLDAPFAQSVRLAADFTDWEKFPLDLIKSEDGVWYTVVPLPPGHYAYRFIVDGQWCDDPHPVLRMPNPFGTANAVVNVA